MDFSEIYITGINASYEECIRRASKGERVAIMYSLEETESGTPTIELVNFSEQEANDFFTMIDNIIGGGAKFLTNYI